MGAELQRSCLNRVRGDRSNAGQGQPEQNQSCYSLNLGVQRSERKTCVSKYNRVNSGGDICGQIKKRAPSPQNSQVIRYGHLFFLPTKRIIMHSHIRGNKPRVEKYWFYHLALPLNLTNNQSQRGGHRDVVGNMKWRWGAATFEKQSSL